MNLSNNSPHSRVTSYYFVQAMSVGAINAFAGIWLAHKGITPEQIGVIFALPVGIIVLVNVAIGRIADRAEDWRQVIVAGALASAVAPLGLLFADGFWGILLVWSVAVITQMMILPVTDAAAIRMSRRNNADFGVFYAWKTIGYLLTVALSGFLLAELGTQAFLPLFIVLSIVRGLFALRLPNFRTVNPGSEDAVKKVSRPSMLRLGFILPLIGWAMVHCTHFVLNGFLGLIWHEQGLVASTIGILIGVSSLSETGMFLGFKRYLSRWSAQTLILISCVIAVVRWSFLAMSPPVEVLFVLQILHAFTYALGFLACTNFIADSTSEDVAAEAQSFFAMVQSALAIVALIGFGWLTAAWGDKAFLVSAAFAGIGAILVICASRLQEITESVDTDSSH